MLRYLPDIMDDMNKSEVARIKQQIAAEQESGQRALGSFAYGASKHEFITRRMERQGKLHERLKELVGEEEAAKILTEAMEKGKSHDQDTGS